jgi:tetratricopeptide (TPR) repeat protein
LSELLTIDDLAELAEAAIDSDDPRAIAAQLVAAVDERRLADGDDACHALHLAAEILHSAGDVDAALGLSARAVSVAPDDPAEAGPIRAGYADRLFAAGRDDEAMAELTAVRPALNLDPDTVENVAVVLVEAGRAEVAHEWLTEALATQRAVAGSDATDDELDVFHQLQFERYHVRRVLDLPMDADDEMARMLQEMADDMQVGLVFWPRTEFDELIRRWPDLTGLVGPDWDSHRAIVESTMVELAEDTASAPDLVAGTVAGLVAFAAERNGDAGDTEVIAAYAEDLDGPRVGWPPPRNEACWCGSGNKYKKCCLPRSRAM